MSIETLFQKSEPFETHKNILFEPLNADRQLKNDKTNTYCHYQQIYAIKDNKIDYHNNPDKIFVLDNMIECLYFIFTDFGTNNRWDDKYWFFVGKLTNGLYFSYETKCGGTGFGVGCCSTIYFAKNEKNLEKYGFTNSQRDLIQLNIEKRFIYSKVSEDERL